MVNFLPIARRELSLASRRSGTYWTRFCSAAAVGGVLIAMSILIREPAWKLSSMVFQVLRVIAFAYCFLAGVAHTSDALSKERRDETLGLLFLTDLRGYDVVIGKLVITSLNTCFGLLAAIPLLAVPVMMGGVAFGEFVRVTLLLFNTLFFSLSIGLAVSALGVNERGVMVRTLGCMVLFTFVLPWFWHITGAAWGMRWLECILLFPSPAYALKISAAGLFVPVRSDFWPSMATIASISLASVVAASLRLPRSLQNTVGAPAPRSALYQLRFGSEAVRARLRSCLDWGCPYLWRLNRDRMTAISTSLMTVGAAAFGLFTLASIPSPGFGSPKPSLIFPWLGIHWLIKFALTLEACRPFSEDKQAGTLELILCTPLTPDDMLAAQGRRLWRLFGLPIVVICIANWCIVCAVTESVLVAAFGLGIFTLLADCWALRWTGMRLSLVSASYARAVFSTLWRVMIPSWIVWFLFVLILMASHAGESSAVCALVLWSLGAVFYDVVLGLQTRTELTLGFRKLATGID